MERAHPVSSQTTGTPPSTERLGALLRGWPGRSFLGGPCRFRDHSTIHTCDRFNFEVPDADAHCCVVQGATLVVDQPSVVGVLVQHSFQHICRGCRNAYNATHWSPGSYGRQAVPDVGRTSHASNDQCPLAASPLTSSINSRIRSGLNSDSRNACVLSTVWS